jgi:hypothetical protein
VVSKSIQHTERIHNMNDSEFDYLDRVAKRVSRGEDEGLGSLSTAEGLYVALAANRPDLIKQDGSTLVQAIARLGPTWLDELLLRHRY